MAKGAYIGVDGVARKIKKGYLGIPGMVPIYKEEVGTALITPDNIGLYFDVENGAYCFVGSGSTFTTNNGGVDDSTASTILTAKEDITALSFNYSYSSESNYDKFTLKVAGTTVENAVSGSTTTKSYSGTLAKGEKIEFTYAKDASQSKNYDKCTFSEMSITGVIKTQIGSEEKSLARKIKKAYIGIGGVARPCWSGGELVYYGTVTALSEARANHEATSNGKYAVFFGYRNTTEAYDEKLTRSTVSIGENVYMENLGATRIGAYALFAGGTTNGYIRAYAYAYDQSLTQTKPSALSTARYSLGATTVGGHALFAGGMPGSTVNKVSAHDVIATVDVYDTSLTRTTATNLSQKRYQLAATTVGGHAIFAGGSISYLLGNVDAYDESLTRSTLSSLSQARGGMGATTVGKFALFAGGGNWYANVDAYNESLTRTTATALSVGVIKPGATTLEGFAIFAGGHISGAYTAVVNVYDESLTRTIGHSLSQARSILAATTVGNYALFGGGSTDGTTSGRVTTVDAFTVA